MPNERDNNEERLARIEEMLKRLAMQQEELRRIVEKSSAARQGRGAEKKPE